MRRFKSCNQSACKTVLNLLEAIYLLGKIVVVTVVEFGVDNRGSGVAESNGRMLNNATFNIHGVMGKTWW